MAFQIDNVGNPQKQNIVDGKTNIPIGGINTTEGRDKLKTFLKKVYDTDSSGNLEAKEMSRLRDEYGKGITAEKLDTVFKNFFSKEISPDNFGLTPVMKKAIETINKKLYGKTAYYAVFKNKNGKEYAAPQNLSKYVANCQNPAQLQKISSYYKMLYSALIKMASRSDTHAQIILNILNEKELYFGFSTDYKTAKLMEHTNVWGTYNMKYSHRKVINIPKDSFDINDFSGLEETLIHESVHALDDVKVDDYYDDEMDTASFYVFQDELKRMVNKDLDALNVTAEKIYAIENESVGNKKHAKYKSAAKEYAFYDPDGEIYAVGEKSRQYIKNNMWMWTEEKDGMSIKNSFTKYLYKFYEDENIDDYEKKFLLTEYIALAVEFYLSPDKTKGARLKRHNPELYAFIEKRFLPAILKNRRLKPGE